MEHQSTNTVFLIRPAHFGYNTQTAASNAFQKNMDEDVAEVRRRALVEFDNLVFLLQSKGINVLVFEDTSEPVKPDAIFPNNWISTHTDGRVVLYPMCAPNRRLERRGDIIEHFQQNFQVTQLVDYSSFEEQGVFLEGTGSILFDRANKNAYACLSPRTDQQLFENVCCDLGYEPFSFVALDASGQEIYHTNVIMCIGKHFAIICLDCIQDDEKKKELVLKMVETKHEIIEISLEQVSKFAGNMLTVQQKNGKDVLVMSETAFYSLTFRQRDLLSIYADLLAVPIPTIETIGGGSVRCMIAEVYL